MKRIRVLIADDHQLLRQSVRSTLRSGARFQIIGEAVVGMHLIELVGRLKPDVVIMGLTTTGMNGAGATRQVRVVSSSTAVLLVSAPHSINRIKQVMRAGARGYVLRKDLARDLMPALKVITKGGRYLSQDVAERLAEEYLHSGEPMSEFSRLSLTSREMEVAQFISFGKSSKEIAAELRLSVRTVETHRANIMRKLNVHSVTQLLRYAFTHKLIQMNNAPN